MQGILCDIKRFAVHDGPGIRTTLFFKGCPLQCAWCHNPESIDPRPLVSDKKIIVDGCVFTETEQIGEIYHTNALMKILKREEIFMQDSQGGITFSGGEPMRQIDFLEDMLISCAAEGYHTSVDTSGQAPWANFERILPLTQLFLFDLKHVDSEKHEAYTGIPNTLILSNLSRLLDAGAKVRIRVPVIPGFNYSEKEQKDIANYIASLKGNIEQVDLLPFHAIAAHKYKRFGISNRMAGVASLHEDDLHGMVDMYNAYGLKTSIGG